MVGQFVYRVGLVLLHFSFHWNGVITVYRVMFFLLG